MYVRIFWVFAGFVFFSNKICKMSLVVVSDFLRLIANQHDSIFNMLSPPGCGHFSGLFMLSNLFYVDIQSVAQFIEKLATFISDSDSKSLGLLLVKFFMIWHSISTYLSEELID